MSWWFLLNEDQSWLGAWLHRWPRNESRQARGRSRLEGDRDSRAIEARGRSRLEGDRDSSRVYPGLLGGRCRNELELELRDRLGWVATRSRAGWGCQIEPRRVHRQRMSEIAAPREALSNACRRKHAAERGRRREGGRNSPSINQPTPSVYEFLVPRFRPGERETLGTADAWLDRMESQPPAPK